MYMYQQLIFASLTFTRRSHIIRCWSIKHTSRLIRASTRGSVGCKLQDDVKAVLEVMLATRAFHETFTGTTPSNDQLLSVQQQAMAVC